MALKSNDKKRNVYRDGASNAMKGVSITEVLDKVLLFVEAKKYTWGLYEGIALKVEGDNGRLGVVEITAETPIQALAMPEMPEMPYRAKFVQRTSAKKRKYYTVELEKVEGSEENGEQAELPF